MSEGGDNKRRKAGEKLHVHVKEIVGKIQLEGGGGVVCRCDAVPDDTMRIKRRNR